MMLDDFDLTVTSKEVSVWSHTNRMHVIGTSSDGYVRLREAIGTEEVRTKWEKQKGYDNGYRHKIPINRLMFGLSGIQMKKGNVDFTQSGLNIWMKVPPLYRADKSTITLFDDNGNSERKTSMVKQNLKMGFAMYGGNIIFYSNTGRIELLDINGTVAEFRRLGPDEKVTGNKRTHFVFAGAGKKFKYKRQIGAAAYSHLFKPQAWTHMCGVDHTEVDGLISLPIPGYLLAPSAAFDDTPDDDDELTSAELLAMSNTGIELLIERDVTLEFNGERLIGSHTVTKMVEQKEVELIS